MAERLRARAVGVVQGVGFRLWAARHARRLGLTGWVMNAPDERSVEVVAEGEPSALAELERVLSIGPPGAHVRRLDAERGTASGEFRAFEIHR
jgi:acylphosphatase